MLICPAGAKLGAFIKDLKNCNVFHLSTACAHGNFLLHMKHVFCSAGLPNVDVTISLPTQPLFSISTPRDLYSWLVADEGLMAFLTSSTKSALFGEAFPQLRQQNGRAFQYYLNCCVIHVDPVCLFLFGGHCFIEVHLP